MILLKMDGDEVGKDEKKNKKPSLNTTDWNRSVSPGRTSSDTRDISPRSKQGEGGPLVGRGGGEDRPPRSREEDKEAREQGQSGAEAATSTRPSSTAGNPAPLLSLHDPGPRATQPRRGLAALTPEMRSLVRELVREELTTAQQNKDSEGDAKGTSREIAGYQPPGGRPSSSDPALYYADASTPGWDPSQFVSPWSPLPPSPSSAGPVTSARRALQLLPAAAAGGGQSGDATPLASPTQRHSIVRFADQGGHLSTKLEDMLEGLGNYIARHYRPKRGVVVTPEKLATFYTTHRLEREPWAYHVLFRGRTKELYSALEKLYLELDCEYHLVQPGPKCHPEIPGLTPAGFVQWMRWNVRAFPDAEAARLQSVAEALRGSGGNGSRGGGGGGGSGDRPSDATAAAGGGLEWLPHRVSRRHLPDQADKESQRLLDETVAALVQAVYPDAMVEPGQQHQRSSSTSLAKAAGALKTADRRSSYTGLQGINTSAPVLPSRPRGGGSGGASALTYEDERGDYDRDRERKGGGNRDSIAGVAAATTTATQTANPASSAPVPTRRTSVSKRNRSPQSRGYRASYPEIHNAGTGSGLGFGPSSPSYHPSHSYSYSAPSVPHRHHHHQSYQHAHPTYDDGSGERPLPLPHPLQLPLATSSFTVRDREPHRDKDDQEYRLYGSPSPRDSRASGIGGPEDRVVLRFPQPAGAGAGTGTAAGTATAVAVDAAPRGERPAAVLSRRMSTGTTVTTPAAGGSGGDGDARGETWDEYLLRSRR